MSLLLSLLLNPTVLAVLGGIVAALGWGRKQRRAGAASERAKRDAADQRVRDIADEVENDIHALTPEQRRQRLRDLAAK